MPFFDPTRAASPLLWQHMFWFYSHPAVYIMILPAFGMISEVLPTFAPQTDLRLQDDRVFVVRDRDAGLHGVGAPHVHLRHGAALAAAAVHGAHHDHRHSDRRARYSRGWRRCGAACFALLPRCFSRSGFLALFTLGGITGVFLAAVPFDLHAHGTYFIVAHFHYVIAGGRSTGALAGLYFWYPKMTGRMLSETMGKGRFGCTSSV